MLRLIGRLILVPLGIALAAAVAAAFLVGVGSVQPRIGGTVTEAAIAALRVLVQSILDDGENLDRFVRLADSVSSLALAVLLLPAGVVAVVAEVFAMRSWFLQMLIGALLTALLPWAMTPELIAGQPLASPLTGLLAATGALAASIYWMVAGSSAGPEPKSVEERATVKAPPVRR
jgi:hypothetical protein